MGSDFELMVVQPDKAKADELLHLGVLEIKRIENLLSEFLPHSETSRINNMRWDDPVSVDSEFFELMERSQDISRLTRGCFDITVGPLKKLYNFSNDEFILPSEQQISETLKSVGYKFIHLERNNHRVFFNKNELRISFSAIGKGYASDCVKKLWRKEGVHSGVINASGDLNAFGVKPDGKQWNVGVADPDNPAKMLFYVSVNNASVATSGDYEQFFMYKNIRYSHNIDPYSGLPVTGIKSVSVFSPSAELSDALATAVYVMGKDRGISFVNELPQTHCIIIDDLNNLYFSKHLIYEEAIV
jgi:thiamine biosynthesis lipoprotein